jgi:hypothetical protein
VKFIIFLLGCAAMLTSGCVSVSLTPARLAALPQRHDEATRDLDRWREAVALCNEFLASPARKTLPPGRINFSEAGMEFVTGEVHLPIRVRCTMWGDWLIPFKMAAQERSDGFVVGSVPPKESRLLDNSFFKYRDGGAVSSAGMAVLILHELTHSYYHAGTVDFFHSVSYYVEAIFLLRYRNHSQELRAYQTSHEFVVFIRNKPQIKPVSRAATADTEARVAPAAPLAERKI